MRQFFPSGTFLHGLLAMLLLTPHLALAQSGIDAGALNQPPAPVRPLGDVHIEAFGQSGFYVAQDSQGFMWFAGVDGLIRYNGYTTTAFKHDPEDPTSLSTNRMEALYVDRHGTLWVGTIGGGLNRFNADTETFTRFQHDPDDPTSISPFHVTSFAEDHDGTLWVGTHSGLNRYDPSASSGGSPDNGTFTHFRHDPEDPTSLSHDKVRALYVDRAGTLWVGTGTPDDVGDEGGLNRFNPESGTFTRYLHDPDDETTLIRNKVISMYEDSRGTFWVGTNGDGLHTMNRSAGTFTRHRYDPQNPTGLSRPYMASTTEVSTDCETWGCGGVSFIHEDRQGRLWIGGHQGGINRYDLDTGQMDHFEAANSGLKDNWVWRIIEAHDGTIWISEWNAGIHKVIASENTFPHYVPDPTHPDQSVGSDFITSFYEDDQNNLWIGTRNGGLDRLDLNSGIFTHYRPDPDDPTSLPVHSVSDIKEAPGGDLWVLHYAPGGLSRLDIQTGRFTHVGNPSTDPIGWNGGTRTILEDEDGILWTGFYGSGARVRRFDPATGEVKGYVYDPSDPLSLPDHQVTTIYLDRQGRLWIGTRGGLRLMDREKGIFTPYLTNIYISEIYEDRAGRFWVGTWDDGLHLFDPATDTSTRYGPEDGLTGAQVAAIIEDDAGFLWISTAEGEILAPDRGRLTRFDPDTETFTNFDTDDGLPDIGFTNHAAHKSRDGTLFFGGDGGFIAFDPATILEEERSPPKMVLSGLRVFNDEVEPGAEAPIRQPIHLADEIRLASDQNDFTVTYAGLAYRNPEGLQYLYTLENHDQGWVSVGSQRTARYSGLSPGTYVFRVRAVDRKGVESAEDASIRVVVLPPWWRTWWAYAVYGLLLIAGVYGVDRIQRRRLLARERERVREREREQARKLEIAHAELQQTHEHLKATQAQLVQQEKMASLGELTAGIAHEIKNPLNFINNFAEMVGEFADELDEEIGSTHDTSGSENTRHFKEILSDLKLNAEQIAKHGRRADGIVSAMMQHASGGTGQREPTDVNALLDEYVNLAYHGKRAQNEGFNCEIERDYDEAVGVVEMVPQEIGRVFLNLLSNAFDAISEQDQPTVRVQTQKLKDAIEIRIQDNGSGIPENLREKIFEPFFTTKPTGSGTGLGLSLSYDIVTQGHGGTLRVENEEGDGATFVITLPV